MANVFHLGEARPVLKVEINKALSMREKFKRGAWWN